MHGCLVIADRRTHITQGGKEFYRDDFKKIVIVENRILYNHGYNRIDNKDWKLNAHELTPDIANPVYARVLAEMATKPDKIAGYVFMSMGELLEITVRVGKGVTIHDHWPHDRIVSGSGDKYVDLGELVDLNQMKYREVRAKLQSTFLKAHDKMMEAGGIDFSNVSDTKRI
jgi:hypothetical protein